MYTSFESTDPPSIETDGYKLIKDFYNLFTKSLISDSFTALDMSDLDAKFSIQYPEIKKATVELPTLEQVQPTFSFNLSKGTKGLSEFTKNLEKYERETGDVMSPSKREALTKFALLESSFNPRASNKVSSAIGYFGVIKANRKDLGSDKEYKDNTNLQFAAASRLYDLNLKVMKPYLAKGRLLGLTDFQMLYGCWFHPKSIISYIQSGGKDSGFKDGLGTSITKILNRARI